MAMELTNTGRNNVITNGLTSFTHIGAYEDLGTTETSGGSYARQAITWTAAGTPAAGQRSNNAQLLVPIAAGKTIQCGSVHDALTGGNLQALFQIGSTLKGTGSAAASTDVITDSSHGLTTDDRVFFCQVAGQALPTGISATVLYFVLASGLTASAFKISTTSGGSALDITADGECAWFKTVPNTFASAGNLTFATNALVFDQTYI